MVNVPTKKRPRENSSSSEASENEYQVEAIVEKRLKGKKTQYLLKWKGYSEADNTVSDELEWRRRGRTRLSFSSGKIGAI